MRTTTDMYGGIRVALSACDTAEWANDPANRWRGSTLGGCELRIELSPSGDLLEVRIDGSFHQSYCQSELRALLDAWLCGEGVSI